MSQRNKLNPVISVCPVCKHDLKVTKLACDHCDTVIEGSFTLSKFNYLETEKLYFIEVFVKNRGNIKAIEKELNISYPTVKKMLDDVIVGLGYTPDNDQEDLQNSKETKDDETQRESKASILQKIANKEISVLDAVELLKKGK
ncbi:MAG: DUF2089 domain-containing protein [Acholeplasmataceae bacterium]|nr:DUF2089 domain-containing protein [Acholeplasmataceae bacterium]